MASISGLQNNPTNNLNTIDGLQIINATAIYENGQPIDIGNLVPYNGATQDLNMGYYNITTDHIAAANSDVVNLQALNTQLSILSGFLINVGSLNYVPFTGATSNTDLGTYSLAAGAITANSSLTVNGVLNVSGITTLNRGQSSFVPSTGIDLTNKTYVDTADALRVPYTGATTLVNLGSNSLVASTAKFTAITSATPSLALGVDALGNLNTFAVPTATNLLPLNNTWTGTNTFNNNLTTADGYTNTFSNAVYTGVNSITSAVPTTTGITAAAPAPYPTITFSTPTYTCTPSGSTTYACFWSSATFTANVRHFFSFTNATTTVYAPSATLSVCQANTANSGYVAISSAYSLPSTATLFTGYFTPNLNASYVGQIFFILSNVKFTPFTWTIFSYGVGALTVQGNTTMTGALSANGVANIYSGTAYAVPNNYMSSGSLTIGDTTKNYGGGTAYWTSNTAGLLMECLDNTEIAVHDAGARVSSMIRYNANTLTLGRDMGWGIANTAISGTLDTASNITMASGTFRKNSSANPNNWASIQEGGAANSPYVEFYYGSLRRGYIGNATASALNLVAENNCDLNVYTGGSLRMIIKNSGLTGFGRDPSYTVDINGNQRVYNGLNANDSMTVYGPNAAWSSYLVVGSGTERSGASTAAVISTNGNLHLDGGNSNSMYYGYYANSHGTPNTHEFYGSSINFNSGLPQNTSPYSGVMCMDGNSLRRSQAVNKLVYFNNNVAWGGGVNMTYAFYLYNTSCSVYIWGKNSGYYSGGGMMQTTIRVYSQSAGTYYYYPINAYVNNGYNHFTVPLDYATTFPYTGWYDIYVYSTSGWITDGNDQLTIGVSILPVNAF